MGQGWVFHWVERGGLSIPDLRTIFDAFALFAEQNIETNYSEVMGHLLSVES